MFCVLTRAAGKSRSFKLTVAYSSFLKGREIVQMWTCIQSQLQYPTPFVHLLFHSSCLKCFIRIDSLNLKSTILCNRCYCFSHFTEKSGKLPKVTGLMSTELSAEASPHGCHCLHLNIKQLKRVLLDRPVCVELSQARRKWSGRKSMLITEINLSRSYCYWIQSNRIKSAQSNLSAHPEHRKFNSLHWPCPSYIISPPNTRWAS